jgi:AAA15 family ATPase/GTPase
MMKNHLKELKITKNYKRLEDVELKSLSRINIIAGANGVGKTALLEMINTFPGTVMQNGCRWIEKNKDILESSIGGILLIDDFEIHLHVEVIKKFVNMVINAVKKYKLQVFVTSHSKECIDAFFKQAPYPNFCSAYALIKRNKTIVLEQFTGSEFLKLLKTGNVDLRRAR